MTNRSYQTAAEAQEMSIYRCEGRSWPVASTGRRPVPDDRVTRAVPRHFHGGLTPAPDDVR